jgi:hypothetical protein
MEENEALRKGLNLIDGKIACQAVAESFGRIAYESWAQGPLGANTYTSNGWVEMVVVEEYL